MLSIHNLLIYVENARSFHLWGNFDSWAGELDDISDVTSLRACIYKLFSLHFDINCQQQQCISFI